MASARNLGISSGEESQGFNYEMQADGGHLLLGIYQFSMREEDIYFDLNQRIVSILTQTSSYPDNIVELLFVQEDKAITLNCFELLRLVIVYLGANNSTEARNRNKLL